MGLSIRLLQPFFSSTVERGKFKIGEIKNANDTYIYTLINHSQIYLGKNVVEIIKLLENNFYYIYSVGYRKKALVTLNSKIAFVLILYV